MRTNGNDQLWFLNDSNFDIDEFIDRLAAHLEAGGFGPGEERAMTPEPIVTGRPGGALTHGARH